MNMRLWLAFILFFPYSLIAKQWKFSSAHEAGVLRSEFLSTTSIIRLSFSCDVPFSQQEFFNLIGLKEGMASNAAMLEKGISYLFQKHLFEDITLTADELPEGVVLHFFLRGSWLFEKLKVHGVWVGKDWYKKYYLMDPGDRFDREKHYHSMTKMKQACMKDGYFNISMNSEFEYNKKTKGVIVRAEINRGKRFIIRGNTVQLYGDLKTDTDDGIARLEKKIAKKISRQLMHAKYAKKVIDQCAKQLKHDLALMGYLHISIELDEHIRKKRHAVELVWRIHLRKKRAFTFSGNQFFSSAQLLDQILQFGRSAWIVPASILATEMRQAYHKKGFWDASIETKDDDEQAHFTIHEGKRATVVAIQLQGITAFSPKGIEKRFFSKIKRRCIYDYALIEQAFEYLIDYYRARGFLDAKIVHHDMHRIKDQRYKLSVMVQEGKQVKIDEIVMPGFSSLVTQGPMGNKTGKLFLYDDLLIQEQKKWLVSHFRKQGYVTPHINPKLVEKDEKTLLEWEIEPGEPITFGKTIVTGISDISYQKVMRELLYSQGERWDQDKIKQSFMRLKGMHLFDSISFVPLAINPDEHTRDVLLKLQKDDPFELRLRGGLEFQYIRQYQTFAGVAYKVGGTFMVKNPSNSGDHFRFDADVAPSHREVRLRYAYPWLFGIPLDGIAQTYATKYEQPGFIGSKKNLYTFYQHGFLAGIRHKNQYIDAATNAGLEIARTTFSDDDLKTRTAGIRLAHAIDFDVRLLDRNIPYFFIEPTLIVNLLDNDLYPTKGAFSLLSLRGMIPTKNQFSNAYFVKLLIEHSWFMSLKQVVAAFRFRFGHIFFRQFSDIMPSERFYLGGSNSIRSYETDLAPPTAIFIDDDGKKHVVPRGGKTMLNINAELRIPIAPKASFVIFQDLGLLCGNSFSEFNAHRLVAGTGFGMRYHTPIGPLRFDIGWKWRKERPEERGFNWVLTFGQAF